ncbi:putative odorant receptor 98b isoform X2 [Leptopilina heterotoma]|uniref:putative odorant receptor 98b isoform X2 n=1 Tax=Leptopilina heterotoma TaxID=63436 RepID=UPI001CA866CA|nr:putative odorant receptor 98b isoform X2 [Leptopilina heterotoma]
MDVLPQNFRTLSLCGLWNETDKFSPVFIIYKLFVLFLIFHISLGQVIYVFVTSKSVKELTNGLIFTVTFVTLCVKLINFVSKVKDMRRLLNMFREDICQPILSEERRILNDCRTKNSRFFFLLIIVSQSVSLTYMSQPIFLGELIELPLRIYDPFDTTDFTMLTILYVMQVVECIYSVCLHMCLDTMIFGFINLVCALFDILCFRLQNMGKGNLSVVSFNDCFKLHIVILKILKSLNSVFMGAIAIMFVLILLVICSGIFQITEKSSKFNVDKIILLYFISFIIGQAYVYCWFGSELEEKIMKSSYAALNVLKCYSEI